jgi:hypothetical protein
MLKNLEMNYTIELNPANLFDALTIAKFCNQMVELNKHRVFPRTTLESAFFIQIERKGIIKTAVVVFLISENENEPEEKSYDVEIIGVAICDGKPNEKEVLEIAKEIKAHSVSQLN